jgi:3-oxoacyl-[acyl-carrier-protein] synthase III
LSRLSADILDACAGWLRALQVAHGFIGTRTYRRGMIVNSGCGVFRQHSDWVFDSVDDVERRVAAFTIGEAATATIVDDTNALDDFHFVFRTRGEHFDLCMIPLQGVQDFLGRPPFRGYVPGRFFSASRDLVDLVTTNIVDLFRSDPTLHRRYDLCFGHEVSEKVCDAVTRSLGVRDVYFPTHRRFGNTVSASIPLGLSVAIQEERLKRGDQVLVIVGASGISVGLASFTF